MAHFALVTDGIVQRVEVVANAVLTDDTGTEQEALGQAFLSDLYGLPASAFVQTHYPNGKDPHPRGQYASVGYAWDGSQFIAPAQPEPDPEPTTKPAAAVAV